MRGAAQLRALLLVVSTLAAASPAVATVPTITSAVTDLTGRIAPPNQGRLADRLVTLREDTGVQMAVLVVDTTAGQPIEDYAQDVFDAWGGGAKGRDDGLLFVLAIADRRSRIHIGYGLEAAISDAQALQMLQWIRTDLQESRYYEAVDEIVTRVRARVSHIEPASAVSAPPGSPYGRSEMLLALLALAALLGFAYGRVRVRRFDELGFDSDFKPAPSWHAAYAWGLWLVVPAGIGLAGGWSGGQWAGPAYALSWLVGATLAALVAAGRMLMSGAPAWGAGGATWSDPWDSGSSVDAASGGGSKAQTKSAEVPYERWGNVGAWASSPGASLFTSSPSSSSGSTFGSSSSSFGSSSSSSSFGGSWSGGGGSSGGGGASSSW